MFRFIALALVCSFLNSPLIADIQPYSTLDKDEKLAFLKSRVPERPSSPKVCAGFRGNGHYIHHHFSSLARIVEHWGVVDAVAGGSSGSITSFLYASIRSNPAVWFCEFDEAGNDNLANKYLCNEKQSAQRVSFLLKTLQAYINTVVSDVETLKAEILLSLRELLIEENVNALLTNPDLLKNPVLKKQLADRFVGSLSQFNFIDLFNPSILKSIRQDPLFYAEEIKKALNAFEFSTKDPAILYRLGLINFTGLAHRFGDIADFYAGESLANPVSQAKALDSCVPFMNNQHWSQVAENPSAKTCKESFTALIKSYRSALSDHKNKLLKEKKNYVGVRVSEKVGTRLPVAISTSIIQNKKAISLFNTAFEKYLDGQTGNNITLGDEFNFSFVKFGYWGKQSEIRSAARFMHKERDIKGRKFHSLYDDTWLTALSLSPAEPGLASVFCRIKKGKWSDFHVLSPKQRKECGFMSAAGWSDLAPVRVLKGLGCDHDDSKIIYVTRRGEESDFAKGVAKLFNMTTIAVTGDESEEAQLYSLENSNSSFSRDLQAASAVYCTDWNQKESSSSIDRMYEHSYWEADLVVNPLQKHTSAFFTHPKDGFEKYSRINTTDTILGCSAPN